MTTDSLNAPYLLSRWATEPPKNTRSELEKKTAQYKFHTQKRKVFAVTCHPLHKQIVVVLLTGCPQHPYDIWVTKVIHHPDLLP